MGVWSRLLAGAILCAAAVCAAEVCPGEKKDEPWFSWSAKTGKSWCVGNEVRGMGAVAWPSGGIVEARVSGAVEMQVCCFESESTKAANVRVNDREVMVATHQEGDDSRGKDDDFPDLIEEDAHAKTVSIRGTLWDGERTVRVDVLLKCSASKFADRYAFQFTVTNRSADFVEVDWDHLRKMRAEIAPSVQGESSVFLTSKRPHEATATVELKSIQGRALGRFQFDGYFW